MNTKNEGKLKSCHICGNAPLIDMYNIKVSCPSCGLNAGYHLINGVKIPSTLQLKDMLIKLWNDLPNRKVKNA